VPDRALRAQVPAAAPDCPRWIAAGSGELDVAVGLHSAVILPETKPGGELFLPIHSEDIAATNARSCSRTEATSKLRAEAAMRVRAAPIAIGGVVSPFFAR
jgi:hypothetical protein